MVPRRKRRFPSVVLVAFASACFAVVPARSSAADGTSPLREDERRGSPDLVCLDSAHKRLAEAALLLSEARARIVVAEADDLRADALRAVEALETRIRGLAAELESCMRRGESPVRSARAGEGIPLVPVPPSTGRDTAARAVDRDRALAMHVRIDSGEWVDGPGRADDRAMQSALTAIAAPLERCYSELASKTAAPNGNAILSFTVDDGGKVDKVQVDLVRLGDASFRTCVAAAARRIAARALGGEATYRFTLGFGPPREAPPTMSRMSEL